MSERYVMRQKILAFGDDFTIKDESGRDVFLIDGKALSFGHKLSFQDTAGNELAYIAQKVFSLKPTYEVHVRGELAAVVTKDLFTIFNCRFKVDVEGPDDIEATGNFLDHEYSFERHGREVGRVSKQWFAWSDTYGVEVDDPDDRLTLLVAAVVIDICCHDEKD